MPLPAHASERDSAAPRIELWGRLDYQAALDRQLEVWSQMADRALGQEQPTDVIAIVEHLPVITLGRHAPTGDVLLDGRELSRLGIAVARSDRGGRATYHGPGQAVVYPIVDVAARGLGIKDWVTLLEDVLLDTIGRYGMSGRRNEGRPGIWVNRAGEAKIASVGLRVARGVSYHGVSINVEAQCKQGFEAIVTCGVADQRVTSIADEMGEGGHAPSVEQVAVAFADALTRRLAGRPRMASPQASSRTRFDRTPESARETLR